MEQEKAKATKPKETKPKFTEGKNDFQDYQKFGELKFLQWKSDLENEKQKLIEEVSNN